MLYIDSNKNIYSTLLALA